MKEASTRTTYIVTFKMPDVLREDFLTKISDQRRLIDRYLADGRVLSYFLSLEAGTVWLICKTKAEKELLELIIGLPLSKYMKAIYSPLTMYQAVFPMPQQVSLS